MFKRYYLKNSQIKKLSNLHKDLAHFEKKLQARSVNISEVIDSEKCGYLNARKLLF